MSFSQLPPILSLAASSVSLSKNDLTRGGVDILPLVCLNMMHYKDILPFTRCPNSVSEPCGWADVC